MLVFDVERSDFSSEGITIEEIFNQYCDGHGVASFLLHYVYGHIVDLEFGGWN